MNRYYKFKQKPLLKYGQAGDILKSPEMGTIYSQTGNIVGNAIEGSIDNNYNYLNFKLNCCLFLFLSITMAHYVFAL